MILESVKRNKQIPYLIEYDLEMIVCCVFHVSHPCKYRDLLSHLKTGLGSKTDNTDTIKQFWEENLVGSTWRALLFAARGGQYSAMKACITNMFYKRKYSKNQKVEVWWLGDVQTKADWYPAKVLTVHEDGSYSVIYQRTKEHNRYLLTEVNSRPS